MPTPDRPPLRHSSHRRLNPLTGEWILVSPQRAERPWLGQREQVAEASVPSYDPTCYLCPGNARAGGELNPRYASTYTFDNDFPALVPDASDERVDLDGLLVARGEAGICRVLCFSPRHDLTLSRLRPEELAEVVAAWKAEFVELGSRRAIGAVQIFENRGEMMGASNPHPHGQIWATASVPNELAKETASLAAYAKHHQRCLLCEYVALEESEGERVVYGNGVFVVVTPYWATWPFETMVIPRRHVTGIDEATSDEEAALADALHAVAVRYDNLFEAPFPYSMGLHQRLTDEAPHRSWHLHAHFYPPLLRSATVRKFMVGFELLAEPQRDITVEQAAARLRGAGDRHYLDL